MPYLESQHSPCSRKEHNMTIWCETHLSPAQDQEIPEAHEYRPRGCNREGARRGAILRKDKFLIDQEKQIKIKKFSVARF